MNPNGYKLFHIGTGVKSAPGAVEQLIYLIDATMPASLMRSTLINLFIGRASTKICFPVITEIFLFYFMVALLSEMKGEKIEDPFFSGSNKF